MSGRSLSRATRDLVPAHAMKTYSIVTPISTHFRDGTCEEAGCEAQQFGWRTTVDETSNLGQMQAHYIRKESGRKFTEEKDSLGMTVFTFEAGQKCFKPHKVRIERPEIFRVRDGDHRGNPTGNLRVHTRPEDWVEDFAEHQQRLADQA